MKIFIYQTAELAPFEGLFEPMGSYQKVILSNHKPQIELFNRHSGLLIKELLPEELIVPNDETHYSIPTAEDYIFLIPLDMKDTLAKLLKSVFKKIAWTSHQTTTKLSKNDIGLIGNDELSQFYDNLEMQAVLQPTQLSATLSQPVEDDETMSKKQELEDLFNSITEQDNEIDAIFVCIHDENKTRIAYSNSPQSGQRTVDTDSFAVQIQHFIAMLKMTNKVNDQIGSLKSAEFLYSNGIVHITHLPQFGEYTFLVFASATEEGIELLALHRKRNLDKILELLGDLFG
ncbi:hypothetical protein BGP_2377 [Beggiatoa sp. PS]|nr:hypothetical protein BGP_2377 [Beggiatoa sp. PS]